MSIRNWEEMSDVIWRHTSNNNRGHWSVTLVDLCSIILPEIGGVYE